MQEAGAAVALALQEVLVELVAAALVQDRVLVVQELQILAGAAVAAMLPLAILVALADQVLLLLNGDSNNGTFC